MSREFYIFQNCELKRKDNNISIITADIKKDIKSEVIDQIYLFGEVKLNTKFLNFASQKNIIIHIFNYYGYYSGSFYPRKDKISGKLLVNQVEHYIDYEKRLEIAKEFILAGASNIYRNLRYYNGRNNNLESEMKVIDTLINRIEYMDSIESLMGLEGNIRKNYYRSWNKIVKQDINFDRRIKRPPNNMTNSLISFLNSIFYTTVLSEIYKTQLDPTVSYLHEPGSKRFSLSLDISEVFKPLIIDRMIFSILNKNQIKESDFEKQSNFLSIKDSAKKKIIVEYEDRLKRTIRHKELARDVSYRYLIRLECYKLIKHLIGEKDYEGFRMWW